MILVPDTQADIRICLGTDAHTLTEVGLRGWQHGYECAGEDAPHVRSDDACQQVVEQSCQQCFTHYSPLDVLTLQRAYSLGWHMGYVARVRGDAWITHQWLPTELLGETAAELAAAPQG